MHFHAFTLQRLAEWLCVSWKGAKVIGCFSQDKNELVIESTAGFLRVGCHTPMTFVVPVPEYARARKNVVDIFPGLLGKRLLNARTVPYERILILELEGETDVILKMHGIRANVLIREKGAISTIFNQQQAGDFDFEEKPGPYAPEAWAAGEALPLLQRLKAVSPILDRNFATYLEAYPESDPFTAAKTALTGLFYLVRDPKGVKLLLLPPVTEPDKAILIQQIAEALPRHLYLQFQYEYYERLYKELDKEIRKPYEKYRNVYDSYLTNLDHLENDRPPEEIGHLLMANLHRIAPDDEEVELEDFFNEGVPLTIKLKSDLTAQENAARYYDKQKQRRRQAEYLREEISDLEEKLLEAESELEDFAKLSLPANLAFGPEGFDYPQMQAIKGLYKRFQKEETAESKLKLPFRTYSQGGYQILVGRNARNNDELSFRHASREDLWLHAKDVTGSHVIIRNPSGKTIPSPVLEYAAQLAAFFSKLKSSDLVPVSYTLRKYVRKRKGDPPGAVAVDREEVILVPPTKP